MTSLPAIDLTTTRDAAGAGDRAERIDWLVQSVAANRFLPMPPDSLQFVGDGSFRLIGAEFLGHFLRYGGLAPHERVLDRRRGRSLRVARSR